MIHQSCQWGNQQQQQLEDPEGRMFVVRPVQQPGQLVGECSNQEWADQRKSTGIEFLQGSTVVWRQAEKISYYLSTLFLKD